VKGNADPSSIEAVFSVTSAVDDVLATPTRVALLLEEGARTYSFASSKDMTVKGNFSLRASDLHNVAGVNMQHLTWQKLIYKV